MDFLINVLTVIGAGCVLGFLGSLIVFGPAMYRFFREEYAGRFPFDKPVWYYRLKKRVRDFWLHYSEDWFGFYLIITVLVALIYHWIF